MEPQKNKMQEKEVKQAITTFLFSFKKLELELFG